jgi:hypothetical protein
LMPRTLANLRLDLGMCGLSPPLLLRYIHRARLTLSSSSFSSSPLVLSDKPEQAERQQR